MSQTESVLLKKPQQISNQPTKPLPPNSEAMPQIGAFAASELYHYFPRLREQATGLLSKEDKNVPNLASLHI